MGRIEVEILDFNKRRQGEAAQRLYWKGVVYVGNNPQESSGDPNNPCYYRNIRQNQTIIKDGKGIIKC